ncbi:MAG: pilus assembly protein [Rhizobiales bacterium]|nr:pilus assembly protein [Hyphomicrobiales bacterium]
MLTARNLVQLRQKLRGFAAEKSATAAIEFAMVLPLMVSLYLGGVEISQAVSADRKVSLVARSVADLVSQYKSVTNADLSGVMAAGTAVVAPFDSSKLSIVVSSVRIDSTSKATIDWSYASNASARTKGASVTVPAGLLTPSSSLIWAEVKYAYKPTIGYVITGTKNLADQIYMRPRNSDSVGPPP